MFGDDAVNEVKLKNYLNSDHLVVATDNDLKKNDLVKGFIERLILMQRSCSINPYQLIKASWSAEIRLVFIKRIFAYQEIVKASSA